MPIHGEYRHLIQHARLAESLGMKKNNIFIVKNGDILLVNKRKAEISNAHIDADAILVDGLGVGDVGNIVLRDRKLLSESGLIIVVAAIDTEGQYVVSGPDIISRGFVYVRENEHLIEESRKIAQEVLEKCMDKNIKDWNTMKSQVRDALGSYIYETTKRSPIILPIFMEV
jgi:ribonuclease J